MRIFLSYLMFFAVLLPFVAVRAAETMETPAKQAIMLDFDTGAILMEKNADERMTPSSMSKEMTMYMVFEALKSGKLTLEQTLPISERAWRMQGSKMFVGINSQVKVEDLVRGVIIQSGNDAAIALAEGVGGTEDNFALMLNKKAEELGMKNSHFMNASGWPDPQHYSTAHDLSILAYRMVHDFPEYYHYYSEKEFTYNNIKQGNRNPLLYRNIGADGIKTGHTDEGGYGLIGSGILDNRRVIFVVNGLSSMQERADESARMLEW
ncbi:MAG TPA: D-alanyl-D-alanine carboxypeptidase family protein, partial [Micavibrio sp.]